MILEGPCVLFALAGLHQQCCSGLTLIEGMRVTEDKTVG